MGRNIRVLQFSCRPAWECAIAYGYLSVANVFNYIIAISRHNCKFAGH
jgi:hypothetical protein